MTEQVRKLIERLSQTHSLTLDEYEFLIANRSKTAAQLLAQRAVETRKKIYGNAVFIRGLIEISNICKNDCYYCGIRKSNQNCDRYRLTPKQIFSCAQEGYALGFRTFVLQGGEDGFFNDDLMCEIITGLKSNYRDCAVTLSIGERSAQSYKRLFDAGADRYLLRHETADAEHYAMLHPQELSYENRMACLRSLKKIGYQVGCGFMVGSPFQTNAALAKDMKFIEEFHPDMCGIGPFVPHKDTPFCDKAQGAALLTCYLLSIVRLIYPPVLLPATTALATIDLDGREKGIQAGANVVMPNLSPLSERGKYELYDNKIYSKEESAQSLERLKHKMSAIGYEIVTDRGDICRLSD